MGQNFFAYLPEEIVIEILSKLPIPIIIRCKSVCKLWLSLLETHLSKSIPGLAFSLRCYPSSCKIFEFEDELNLQRHELHYKLVTEFDFPYRGYIQGSANGLLFLGDLEFNPNHLFIYNPITREYIQLDCPQDFLNFYYNYQKVTCGFGVSQISGEHKVVRVSQDRHHNGKVQRCHVYTLGTASWRSIKPGVPFWYIYGTIGSNGSIFLNGNIHWLVEDTDGSMWISCFDLETEVFSTFSTPSLPRREEHAITLSILGDCLCFCDSSSEDEIGIWLMKKYENEKSWTKEFVIGKGPDYYGWCCDSVYPIKLFKDGDILMAWESYSFMVYYSNKTKTIQRLDDVFEKCSTVMVSMLHSPSFLSLKKFTRENVRSFHL